MVIIGEFIFVSYLLYTLTVSVYKSYQIDQHIKTFEVENAKIEEENRQKSEEFDYYNSSAYVEKIAKQNLNLVNPGEDVIIIPNDNMATSGIVGDNQVVQNSSDRTYNNLSNPQKWWKFFFDISPSNP